MKTKFGELHIKDQKICLSECCNAEVRATEHMTIQMVIEKIPQKVECSNCNKICKRNWFPLYQYIGEGSYRKIEYTIKTK